MAVADHLQLALTLLEAPFERVASGIPPRAMDCNFMHSTAGTVPSAKVALRQDPILSGVNAILHSVGHTAATTNAKQTANNVPNFGASYAEGPKSGGLVGQVVPGA